MLIRLAVAGLLLSQNLLAGAPQDSCPDSDLAAFTVDLRPAFKKWALDPRLQGKRGTCSVFTMTGALEYAVSSKCGGGPRLSVEFLNWASNQALGQMRDGGFFSDLWRGFAIYGICPELDMPYRDEFDPALAPGEESKEHARGVHATDLRLHWIKRWNPNTGLTGKQAAAIKRTLGRQWPVCAGFRWPKNVQWENNTLVMPPPEGVFDGHSVLLVGYRDDPEQPGGGLFLFRDSNHNGPERCMTYEYACAYMNDAVWIDYETRQRTLNASAIRRQCRWREGMSRRVDAKSDSPMSLLRPGKPCQAGYFLVGLSNRPVTNLTTRVKAMLRFSSKRGWPRSGAISTMSLPWCM